MAKKRISQRVYDDDFKAEAVQMLLDGHSASSVAQRLGESCPTTVRRWKRQQSFPGRWDHSANICADQFH